MTDTGTDTGIEGDLESRAAAPTEPARPRLLLIDDDEADRMMIRRGLRSAHFNCDLEECSTAAAALALTETRTFDCVLLDYLLPGETAIELLPRLRAALPDAPFIVLTGHGDEQVAVSAMKAGAADYLSKDHLDVQMLAKVLHQALALQAARTRLERAERAREAYAAKLRELVQGAPLLYHGMQRRERLAEAARLARQLLDGKESFVEWRDRDGALRVEVLSDGSLADATQSTPSGEQWNRWVAGLDREAPASPGPRIRPWGGGSSDVVLWHALAGDKDSESKSTGLIAVRCHAEPSELFGALASLLAQIGQMLTASVENLRLYEVAQKALVSRDAVMAVVSHDLRSPLNAMGIGIQLLQKIGSAGDNSKVLFRMERAAAHMKRLIEDLLDVTNIENRSFQLTQRPEPLAPIFDEVNALMGAIAENQEISLTIEPAPPATVIADRYRVVQVLSNLLGNAIKFTPPGGKVVMRAEIQPPALLLSIEDNGSGIEPEHLPRVFERYWRKEGRGLGLGLFIAKAIVDAHGGDIRVASEVGKGSTFTLSIPLAGST